MTPSGTWKLLKIIINEDALYKGHNLHHILTMKFKEAGLAGVTVYRGIEGYGHSGKLHSARILELSASLPIVMEAVDRAETIEAVLPMVRELVLEGLVTVTDVTVLHCGGVHYE